MTMTPQPTELWIVWDETDGPDRDSYCARLIGWVASPNSYSPYPFVVHPYTELPSTLGLDSRSSVSRMQVVGGRDADEAAVYLCESRREQHDGRREPVGGHR